MNPLIRSGASALCPELTGREARLWESELKDAVAPEARTEQWGGLPIRAGGAARREGLTGFH